MYDFTTKDEIRFWNKVVVVNVGECWTWTASCSRDGYGKFGLHCRTVATHRIAYELCIGPIPDGICVLHHCDNRLCVNPAHLFLGTRTDNSNDRDKKGRQARGETSGQAKLSDAHAIEIRIAYATRSYTQAELGRMYGVCGSAINQIVHRKQWKHV